MATLRHLSLITLVAVISACADAPTQPHLDDPSLVASADQDGIVPFKGVITHESISSTQQPGPSFDPGCVNTAAGAPPGQLWVPSGTVDGTLNATHVGRSTLLQNGCLEISALFPPFPANPILAIGEATITAANGDEVFYHYSGVVDPATFVADVDVVITGGSGRFVGATGGFSSTSEGNAVAVPVVYRFSGTISSVGSLK